MLETRPGQTSPGIGTDARPTVDGRAQALVTPAKAATRRGPGRRLLLVPVGLVALLAAVAFGYRYWYNATHFVWTDNAQVSGAIIQVGALNAGQVTAVLTDVGQTVQQGQVVARVSVPQPVAATSSGTPKLSVTNTQNQQVDVTSPLTGLVVSRLADSGSTVAAGQPIVAVVDPTRLYVTANVNETDVDRIAVGEPVDVTVDSLGATLPGRVVAITSASAAAFSMLPQQTSSGNFTKVVQVVPVKIAVDYGNAPLVVGSSVEVNIHVR